MAGYLFENLRYTPQEIESMKANNERAQNQAAINAQNLSLGLNIAQNLNPLGGLGFLLGNLGGQMYNNYRARGEQKKIDETESRLKNWWNYLHNQTSENNSVPNQYNTQSLDEYAQNLIPSVWRNKNDYANNSSNVQENFQINNDLLKAWQNRNRNNFNSNPFLRW